MTLSFRLQYKCLKTKQNKDIYNIYTKLANSKEIKIHYKNCKKKLKISKQA